MIRHKEKLNPNVQVNFNKSKEMAYWAKKLNLNAADLQKKFEEFGSSISHTIAYYRRETSNMQFN
ncbi:hypothetical protein [Parasediminibacterium sp. JCM 36343]|uniref:hypothetical protein n=1 Tax=Parasediminibacterium sp. JCM 36343 TaxID=3374279 RepID=UPI00397BB0AB